MPVVKTAISLEEGLYHRLEGLAERKRVPRSQLYSAALDDYARREEARELTEQMNAAYAEPLDEEEQAVLDGLLRLSCEVIDEWEP